MQNSLNDEITDGVIYLHSLLHTKLLTTVSSNSSFHKHGTFFLQLTFCNKTVAVHCRVSLGRKGSVSICRKSSDSQEAKRRPYQTVWYGTYMDHIWV